MSFNGSGTFVINSAGQPVVANTVISATTFNALTSDLANGLSTCITKDGQTTPTANIPMGGFKITNLATGTAASDAATVAQIQSNGAALVTVTGTDTLTGTLTPALVAYVTGAVYYFVAPATNTGAVTLNIDTLGAKNVTRDGTTALVAGDIVSGEMVAVVYDGTRFQLISPVNSFTNLNVSGTLTVAGATTLNGNLQVGNAAADTVNFQASGWTLTNPVSITGTWADIGTITTADINGGTIDGTTIGGGTAAAGTFTTVGATTGNITTVNATTVDSTNLEVTNLKAKDGTAAGSIADSTGVVTLNSVVATTADINGGTIDATTIGGSSPAVGNFTTVSAASAVFTTATITTVNTTTLDLTNLEVTNIKAKDGTASMVIDDATGKVNVTTVSAASMNAAVAAVTTLNATSASAASINAAVALITTGTVTNLIVTGASITSANVGALQVTNASVASANLGTAQITAVSAASANLGVAAITTGTVTDLTATSASIASMNAGVALLTTATVTTLNASGASIASANIGNLQFTAASIASINAGVAVINNLTATAASVASANVGVALITTGTVTNLTATSASVASANVGTAVITGLTVTGASIASVNAGTATLSGNLTLNGGTANGVLYLNGSKVATSGSALTFDGTNLLTLAASTPKIRVSDSGLANDFGLDFYFPSVASSYGQVTLNGSTGGMRFVAGKSGSSGYYQAFELNGSEQARLTSTGLGIGTSSPAYKLDVAESGAPTSTNTFSVARISGSDSVANDLTLLGPNTSQVRIKFGDPESATIGEVGYNHSTNSLRFVTNGAEAGVFDSSGNLGIGTSSPTYKLHLVGKQIIEKSGAGYEAAMLSFATITETGAIYRMGMASGGAFIIGRSDTSTTNLTLDSSGNLGIGTSSPSFALDISQAAPRIRQTATTGTNSSLIQLVNTGGTAYVGLDSSSGGLTTAYSLNLFHSGAYPICFSTSSTERARITSGGDLLVAKTATSGTTIGVEARANGFIASTLAASTNASSTLDVYSTGATAFRFYVTMDGTVNATNTTISAISDQRLKENIRDLDAGLAEVLSLKPRKFDWKEGKGQDKKDVRGFIAQEFEQVFPDLIDEWKDPAPEGEEPYKSVRQDLIPVLVKAIQEQQAMIKSLEAKVAALESK
jgi:hypothetical protein